MGYKNYLIANKLGQENIKVIITDKTHYKLSCSLAYQNVPRETERFVPISIVKIREEFAKTKVKKEKMNDRRKYIEVNGMLDKPLILNKDNILVDGYSRYIIAKKFHLGDVPVKYI